VRPWSRRKQPYFRNEPSRFTAWRLLFHLYLTNMKLKWISKDSTATQPTSGEVDLGLAGTLQGGQFLVIFEDANYTGNPVAQNFNGPIPGIKVKNGFFPDYGPVPASPWAPMARITAPISSSSRCTRTK
jgi:hypothetical protein